MFIFHKHVNAPPGYVKSRKFHDLLSGDKEIKEDPVL